LISFIYTKAATKLKNIPMPNQWFFLKNFEQSEGLSKLVEIIKIKINKIFTDTATKYNKEKELKIPIKRRKVISKK
jgi:hypothetical protein